MIGVPEPTNSNPFRVGDLVEVVIGGWNEQKIGDMFVVADVDDRHVSADKKGGGWFTRYRLVERGTLRGCDEDEYEAALEAQEAYQAIVGS